MRRITHIGIVSLLVSLLVYTRFVNLGWGLPYPMHPDERNMADSVSRLQCKDPFELTGAMVSVAPQNFIIYLTKGESYIPKYWVSCMNPEFYAYGQLSLYLGYFLGLLIQSILLVTQKSFYAPPPGTVGFTQAILGLRLYSAIASCLIPLVGVRLLGKLHSVFRKKEAQYIALLCFIFSPVLIQFAHFGTTESVLMLLYLLIVEAGIHSIQRPKGFIKGLFIMSIYVGLAVATKVSSLLFLMVPGFVLVLRCGAQLKMRGENLIFRIIRVLKRYKHTYAHRHSETQSATQSIIDDNAPYQRSESVNELKISKADVLSKIQCIAKEILQLLKLCVISVVLIFGVVLISLLVSFVASPHNLISLRELLGSLRYESEVGLGTYIAFYTRQFLLEQPIIFQIRHIFPYALGSPIFVLSIIGLIVMPRSKTFNLFRLAILSFLFLTTPWYAKWTRFIAPLYPLLIMSSLLASTTLFSLVQKYVRAKKWRKAIVGIWVGLCILPGIAFLSVYRTQDVRFVASKWIYKNMSPQSYVLSETANVVDTPIPDVWDTTMKIPDNFGIQYISFNLYELDNDRLIQNQLSEHLKKARYIFVPSRRIYYNHTCVGLDGKDIARHSKEKCEYLAKEYPQIRKYYQELFSGKSGFKLVAEFSSYPRLELFGKTLISFPDEESEETYTVFDHPVLRIYERVR